MRILPVALTFFWVNAHAQTFDYLPAPGSNQIIHYEQFSLSYIEEHEQAEWVAYELTKKEVVAKMDRCNCFKADTKITTGSAALSDYRGSGYDRGHLSPSAANKISSNVNKESFLMSNMSPQLPGFNRYIWKDLEAKVRDIAYDNGKVYVVTGPVFNDNLGSIGTNEVTIPGYYYKVVLFQNKGRNKAIGFLLRHKSSKADLSSFAVSIDKIEAMTGIDFFPALQDDIEMEVEGKVDLSDWDWK